MIKESEMKVRLARRFPRVGQSNFGGRQIMDALAKLRRQEDGCMTIHVWPECYFCYMPESDDAECQKTFATIIEKLGHRTSAELLVTALAKSR